MAYRRHEDEAPFIFSALDEGGRLALYSCCFILGENAPAIHTFWVGDWVGLRAVLDMLVKNKFL
jgi:hypothetical protein